MICLNCGKDTDSEEEIGKGIWNKMFDCPGVICKDCAANEPIYSDVTPTSSPDGDVKDGV